MKRKVFMQLVIMLVMSGIAVLLLYNFLQGKIGVWGIGLLSLLPGIDYEQAYKIYEMIFREHWTEFMFAAMAVVFLILFHFSLTWFRRTLSQLSWLLTTGFWLLSGFYCKRVSEFYCRN